MRHKFLQKNFNNCFETHNAILDITPYEPEVLFIGTFNPDWQWNPADFFYGRGMYMWTILGNLFINNKNQYSTQRTEKNDIPSLEQIFEICKKGKLSFADIIKGVKGNISTICDDEKKEILVNNEFPWSGYKDTPLDEMGKKGWLDDNVSEIIDFIEKNVSVKHVYFTFKSGNWLVEKLNDICDNIKKVRNDISVSSIFTPTGNGFGANLPQPFDNRAWSISHCWVWNNLNHKISIDKVNYGHLNHDWLKSNGVNPNQF